MFDASFISTLCVIVHGIGRVDPGLCYYRVWTEDI